MQNELYWSVSAEVVQVHVSRKSKRLIQVEKKQAINSWKRHGLCDLVLSYERWTRY